MLVFAVIAMTRQDEPVKPITDEERLAAIPASAVKMTPDDDLNKPVIHSDLWEQPVPMPGPVNSAGAEDSPFITANGTWFFFFFTPDVAVPVNEQLLDGLTGIWWTKKVGDVWSSPEKVVLCDDVSLDGAEFVLGEKIWFASVRAGNLGEIDVYTAEYEDGRWTNVENAGEQLNVDYDIGEFHISSNGNTMYFHTGNLSGGANMDLWTTQWVSGSWSEPERIEELTTDNMEGYPFVTQDGTELWYTGWSTLGYTGPAIFRSVKQLDGTWGPAVEMISNFAGECTIDPEGNIYFVHHYYSAEQEMIEADIYVAYKK